MIRVPSRSLRLVAAGLTLAVVGTACGSPSTSTEGKAEETTTTTIAKGSDTTAAQLSSKVNGLLAEYIYLGTAANGAAIRKRPDEFIPAAAAFRANSDALSANMSAAFGDEVGKSFNTLWKKHVEYFINYTVGVGDHDAAKSAAAMNDLAQYTKEFGTFINSILPSLAAEAVTARAASQVQTFKSVIDAQAAGNWQGAYTNARAAAAEMATLGGPLIGAIAKAMPDKVSGDPASKAANLVTGLNTALREHVFLVAAATNAAVAGRADEFAGAKAALDANSDAITSVIAGVYGDEAGKQFDPLWKKHIGFLVDYTNAVAAKDQAKADEAMGNLLGYTDTFGAFINAASPKLTKDAVAGLIKTHVFTLKDVIDAQAAKNFTKAYTSERTAADHMAMIATGLATTVVAQFPTKF